jgi:hypothetical protein
MIESVYRAGQHDVLWEYRNFQKEQYRNEQINQTDKENLPDVEYQPSAEQISDSEEIAEKKEISPNNAELSEQEKKQVEELKAIDRKIRQHEMAHLAAAAGIAVSGANFDYKRGPDGVMYAVGGDVQIDTSPVPNNPQATIEKAQKIARAALAPVDPSPQDRKVAAQARAMEAEARAELVRENQQEINPSAEDEAPSETIVLKSYQVYQSQTDAKESSGDQGTIDLMA